MKSKNRFFTAAFLSMIILESCAPGKEFSAKGIIEKIEYGKDGYTASLKGKNQNFDALISRVRMEKEYRVLKVGEKVELFGDTIHLDNKVRVLVKKIR